jgi:hypothetical protein
MNDVASTLRAQAAVVDPSASVEDVLARARRRRRAASATRGAAGIAAVALVGAAFVAFRDPGSTHGTAAVPTGGLPALLIDRPPVHGLERRDTGAASGPTTVIVRRHDGSMGVHGAVVAFPVGAPTGARSVTINGGTGIIGDREIVWPLGGAYARVRGDLGLAQLRELADRVRVVAGQPRVDVPDGFAVVFSGPYRAPSVHEARYGSARLGEQASLGDGLAYTGVLRAGGFEDQLYARNGRPGFRVRDRPAVLSAVQGGNDTLAWELSPGVVAYVGYSGSSLDDHAAAALVRLGERSRVISTAKWEASKPGVSDQRNDFGS